MKIDKIVWCFGLLLIASACCAQQQLSYTITDLGYLDERIPETSPRSINARGQVVGYSSVVGLGYRGFIWQDGLMQDLGFLTGISSFGGDGINNRGEVISQNLIWDSNCLSSNNCTSAIVTVPPLSGGLIPELLGINNPGDLIGYAGGTFFWSTDLSITNLGPLYPVAINDRGDVVGGILGNFTHAYLWSNGVLQDLGTLAGSDSFANAINNAGDVVGWSDAPDGSIHAFLWRNGVMSDLGTYPGFSDSYAYGINDRGQIIGQAYGQSTITCFQRRQPLLWDGGSMYALTDLIPSDSGWNLQCSPAKWSSTPNSINNRGQIVGTGFLHQFTHEGDRQRGYLMNPKGGSSNPAN